MKNFIKKYMKKNIIITVLSIVFFIIVGLNLLFPGFVYGFCMDLSGNTTSEGLLGVDTMFFICTFIFIVVVIDFIVDIWNNVKLKKKKCSLVLIIIFILLNIFSSPIGYITDNSIKSSNHKDYRLDTFLTCIDVYSNEGDFEGGTDISKYLYIPFLKKIIIFNKENVVTFNDKNYSINYGYYEES